jgi:hypothetical protein
VSHKTIVLIVHTPKKRVASVCGEGSVIGSLIAFWIQARVKKALVKNQLTHRRDAQVDGSKQWLSR